MIQVDVPLAAAVGSTFALAARVQLRKETNLAWNRYLAVTLVYSGVFLGPALLIFLNGWPAWDTMYWWSRETMPVWLPAFAAFASVAMSGLGFVATHALIRQGREVAAFAIPVVIHLGVLGSLVVFHQRFLHVGTQESFAAGAEPNLLSSNLLWALLTVIPLWVGVPLAVIALRWIRDGMKEA